MLCGGGKCLDDLRNDRSCIGLTGSTDVHKLKKIDSLLSILDFPNVALTPAKAPSEFGLGEPRLLTHTDERSDNDQPLTTREVRQGSPHYSNLA